MGQTEQVISIDRTSGTAASRRIGTTPLADDVELDATEGGLAPPTPPKPPAPPDYDDGIRWPDDVPNDEPPELVMTPTAREAINQILDAHKQGGFAVVSGLAGLGKTSMAMLLEQRLDQRDLRPPLQSGDRERVRVGLLELVGRAVDDELAELVDRRDPLQVARQRRAVSFGQQCAQAVGDVLRRR